MPVRKRFGQNFLTDRHIISQIVRAVNPQQADHLVEIGPGHGAITAPLLASGADLQVVEIDRDLVAELQQHYPDLIIHSTDVLKFDFAELKVSPLRIVGNLPYNISTPLLFRLFQISQRVKDMHFMLQREVVDRICAEPGTSDYGRLSVMAQIYCQAEKLFTVPPGSFSPPPKVYSAVIRLVPHETPALTSAELIRMEQFLARVFSQRRKTIRNAMKGLVTEQQLHQLDLDPALRPENLSVADYINCIRATS